MAGPLSPPEPENPVPAIVVMTFWVGSELNTNAMRPFDLTPRICPLIRAMVADRTLTISASKQIAQTADARAVKKFRIA